MATPDAAQDSPSRPRATRTRTTTAATAAPTAETWEEVAIPAFRAIDPGPSTDPTSTDPSPTSSDFPPDGSGWNGAGPDAPYIEPPGAPAPPSSSAASTEGASLFAELIAPAVLAAMFAIHRFVVRRRRGLDTGAWLPSPEPAAAIAAPLARIADRHAPPGLGASGDLGDMVEAGTTAIGWHIGELARDQQVLAERGAGFGPDVSPPAPSAPTAEPPSASSSSVAPEPPAPAPANGPRGNDVVGPGDLRVSPAKGALATAWLTAPMAHHLS
jgi:hypothetical protein